MSAEAEARRSALIYASAMAIVGSAAPICISMGALAGHYLLDADKSLASLPVTGFNVGVALGALPAAALLRGAGQRGGFMLGTVVTALGGAVAALGLFQASFWLFAAGLMIVGLGGAFVQQLRFAAADNAPAAFKARAISFVLAGGVVTAILGPQIVIFTRNLFEPVQFAGAFAAIVGLAAVGAIILSRLPARATVVAGAADDAPARPLSQIIAQPRFAVAMLCGVSTYALMSFVMTGAPLAMVGCGFTPEEATLGISWHVIAMFAPSFVTGRLITRFGAERIIAAGLLLLVGCAIVALSGIALWQFWTALILLGLGWNFGFIGSTAIVAQSYRPSEKGRAQGFHDFVLFSSVAFGSLMSGVTYNLWGWDMLNWIVFPVVVLSFVALGLLAMARRRPDPVAS